jgi:hypothetical protein
MKGKRYAFAILLIVAWFILTPIIGAQNESGLSVQISHTTVSMMAGEWATFNTLLHNDGQSATPPLVAHLNIAAVKQGPYVDPEDWSPRRTQYLPPVQPGEMVEIIWQVHALTEGEFGAFVTIISPQASFEPVVSSTLLLQVAADNILPFNQVIPVVTVVPLFPLGLLLFSVGYARKQQNQTR